MTSNPTAILVGDVQPRVFISYARADGETFATQLRERLERDYPAITLWQDRAQMEGAYLVVFKKI